MTHSAGGELFAVAMEVYEAQAQLRRAQDRLCKKMEPLLHEPLYGDEVRYVQAPDLSVWRLLWQTGHPRVERVPVVQVRESLPEANTVGWAAEPLPPLDF